MRHQKTLALVVAGLLAASGAGTRADASFWDLFGLGDHDEGPVHTARLRVLYTVSPNDEAESSGTFPAAGLTVGVYTHTNLFGTPEIDAAGETGPDGVVSLSYHVKDDEQVRFRIETDGSKVKTFPGAWNLFHTPHRGTFTLSNDDSHRDVAYDLTWGGDMNNAIGVQSAGFHARTYGENVFAPVTQDVVTKVGYSFPGWILYDKDISYTPLPDRVVVAGTAWGRAHHTIFHETGHTFWLAARGLWKDMAAYLFEPSWNARHSFTEPCHNDHLAMSEGFADWFAVLVKDHFGAVQNRPDIANHTSIWVGEDHFGRYHPEFAFAQWGGDNETNVADALYDLVDMQDDDKGLVPGFTDHSHLGSLEDGMRAVFQGVRQQTGISFKRFSLHDLWHNALAPTFGQAGADALRMNGVNPD